MLSSVYGISWDALQVNLLLIPGVFRWELFSIADSHLFLFVCMVRAQTPAVFFDKLSIKQMSFEDHCVLS